MSWASRESRRPSEGRAATAGSCLVALIFAGCAGETAEKALDRNLKERGQERTSVAKFAGKVLVDGQTPQPSPRHALVVVLYDAKNPPGKSGPFLHAVCDKDGKFEFTTYTRGDGVAPGTYNVLFAMLVKRRGAFLPPDGLKNLYNDPDKTEHKYDVAPPGKADYEFDLALAGKNAVTTPGPNAVTSIGGH